MLQEVWLPAGKGGERWTVFYCPLCTFSLNLATVSPISFISLFARLMKRTIHAGLQLHQMTGVVNQNRISFPLVLWL